MDRSHEFLFVVAVTFIAPIANVYALTIKLYDDSTIVLPFRPDGWEVTNSHVESIDVLIGEGTRICEDDLAWQVDGRAVGHLQEMRNRKLSEKRALGVQAMLVKRGVDKSKIFMRISGSDYGRFDVTAPDFGHRVEVRRICRLRRERSK